MAYITSSTAVMADRAGQGMFSRLRDALRRRRVYATTLRELNSLSTRDLTDLGLNRSMLTRVALEAAYGKRVN